MAKSKVLKRSDGATLGGGGPHKKQKRAPGQASEHGASVYGPPVATTSGRLSGGASDEWQTTHRAWCAIADLLAPWRTRRIWMPFYYDGQCAEHLRALGFVNVIHKAGDDFFVKARDPKFLKKVDLIWDNPPYTNPDTKEAVLRALAKTGKPFVMLLPISVLHVGFVREIVDMAAVQAIVPRRVHVRKSGGAEIPFKYLCWFCSGVKLKRDLVFVDDDANTIDCYY
jgi:hypothetical protein|tara:strand:+ start:150 stop:827 length:678 start_codon:yes stop_codon:yes gene_type:complete